MSVTVHGLKKSDFRRPGKIKLADVLFWHSRQDRPAELSETIKDAASNAVTLLRTLHLRLDNIEERQDWDDAFTLTGIVLSEVEKIAKSFEELTEIDFDKLGENEE